MTRIVLSGATRSVSPLSQVIMFAAIDHAGRYNGNKFGFFKLYNNSILVFY
jgi:hypothetical protein